MKFNLGNRPILLDTRKSVEETLDWFEGFEKELRQKIELKTTFDEEKLIREILAE